MAHKHSVYDTDTHFIINPITREIKNDSSTKTRLMQKDHNSERYSFELQREIEAHDMSLCDTIKIHYINTETSTKESNYGIYEVDDLEISEDGSTIVFTWLITDNATQKVGPLSFRITFECTTEGSVDYRWSTNIYSAILVSDGIDNSEAIMSEYADVLVKWKKEVLENVNPTVTIDTELNEESDNAIANCTVAKKISQLSDSIANLNGGTPTPVSLVSEMTDTTKVYLYTGTEDGFVKGNWYYHYGTSWVSGGKYGGSASGTGWTSTQITLLETIGNFLVFTDASIGQAMFDSLIASLRSGSSSGSDDNTGEDTGGDSGESGGDSGEETPTSYTITNSLVNVTTDNETTNVEANGSYTATLTPDSNYYIDSVVVTMGGVNVTNTVYADGVITIPEVTGNVVIVASGAESDNLIVLSECTDGDFMPDGAIVTAGSLLVTPLIPVDGEKTYHYNFVRQLPSGTIFYSQKIYLYDASQTYFRTYQVENTGAINLSSIVNSSGEYASYVRCMFSVEWTNPYFGESGVVV